ncbi:uncharacterized protein LOC114300813 [Camellia sinensis]|uniref:uncharacterized protein LOC114300813 n=1 Tax=Camellia sinensis TaxID=4442 RepID=UPI00103622DB|nr:uncharacterized protein LOC114300813 [Camellia sinensis]
MRFLDAYSGFHQIPMFILDQEATTFINPTDTYCYKVIPFGLKNVDEALFPASKEEGQLRVERPVLQSTYRTKEVSFFPSSSVHSNPQLFLYLAVSDPAVSAVLIREEWKEQKTVYYVSKTLLDVEFRYMPLENLAYALLITSRKLAHYFQGHTINVLAEYPLKSVFN